MGGQLANGNGKAVRQFLTERFGKVLSRSSCLRSLHRLDFVGRRPNQRFTKADPVKRAAFIEQYAVLVAEARRTETKIFFADAAHFRADVDLRGRWVQRGKPALVDSNRPRWGEKASYYSAVCWETGEVEVMELEGNSCAATSVAFLQQLRAHHPEPLIVIGDNGPAHGGDAMRVYLATPNLRLHLVRLPAYCPDFNPDEAVGKWVREEVTANTCLGTKAKVEQQVGAFFSGLGQRLPEVQRRCRTRLQAEAESLTAYVVSTWALL